jgi:LytS/YehU family sensor histidine kinase
VQCLRIPGGTDAPRRAGVEVLATLKGQLNPSRGEDVALVVSELVSNSVRHGQVEPGADIEVDVLVVADGLRLSVVVPTPNPSDRLIPADALQSRRLDLLLVDRLSTAWGFACDRAGVTRVWCELSLAPVDSR